MERRQRIYADFHAEKEIKLRNPLEVEFKEKEIITKIRKRKTQYIGKIGRHDSLQKKILEEKVDGKRGRGKRRKSL